MFGVKSAMLGFMKLRFSSLLVTSLLVIGVVMLSGCNLAADAVAKNFNVGLEPNTLSVAPGEEGRVKVTIKPLTGVELKPGEARVSLFEPPAGISAEDVTIPSGLDATLIVEVAEDVALTQDEPLELEIRAVKDGVGDRATLELTIAESAED